jgi:methyl-accepting chemotaxis protein
MTRIKKFYEAREEINNDSIREILSQVNDVIEKTGNMRDTIQNIYKLLDKYTSESEESNDQIDESTIELNATDKKLEEVESSLTSVTEYLNNYIEDGRKYLF